MAILDIKDNKSLINAAKVLKLGGILVFPTDTVYGIGCALNSKAILKLYNIKKRSIGKPTAILITKKYYQGENIDKILKQYPKGKITIVVDVKNLDFEIPPIILKNNKVGIRFPEFTWLEELIDSAGPIAASSANFEDEPAPKNYDEIDTDLINKSNLTIRTDEKLDGKPSTVVDLEKDEIIRK